jgi:hypothetical protein
MRSKCVLFSLVLIGLFSCQNAEDFFIKDFNVNYFEFEKSVKYIEKEYVNTNKWASFNRVSILFCEREEKFAVNDSRICDRPLGQLLGNTRVVGVSVEKNVCFKDRNFDLLIYELSDVADGRSYYYYYSFCDSYNNLANSNSFKNIPLMKNWSLFVEKR